MCGMGMISKEKHLFYTIFKKNLSHFLLFQYFFVYLPTLPRPKPSGKGKILTYSLYCNAEACRGREELLMRSDLTVGNHLWIRRLLDALFLTL